MKKWWGLGLGTISVVALYVAVTTVRPLTLSIPQLQIAKPKAEPLPALDLGLKRSAIGYIDPASNTINCRALGEGVDYTEPRPTASLAKTITVQVVLDKYPLKDASDSGPVITMSADDEARYWQVLNEGGSNVRVVAGEQISERQLIEGVMLSSANNMADSLAIWAFGSIDGYKQAASAWLKQHGLVSTLIGDDASGFHAGTKSTPVDLCKITLLAAQNPALASILSEHEATMPTGDVARSTNRLLLQGRHSVFGGKTGYTDDAGYGVLMMNHVTVNGEQLTAGAVTLSHGSYNEAFESADKLLATLPQDIKIYKLSRETSLGRITSQWGQTAALSASHGLLVPYWADQPPQVSYNATSSASDSISHGTIIGQITVAGDSTNIIANNRIAPASFGWRLSHPL